MITIYKHGQIPKSIETVKLNDVYFNKYTAQMLDNRANRVIEKIDHAELTGPYTIKSRFDGTTLNTDKFVLPYLLKKACLYPNRKCRACHFLCTFCLRFYEVKTIFTSDWFCQRIYPVANNAENPHH